MKNLLVTAGLVAGAVVLGGASVPAATAQVRAALTQNVDEPGRNAFTLRQDNLSGSAVSFTVPSDKRYVIDQYTGDCGTPNTTSLIDVELITSQGGAIGFYHTPVHYTQNVGFGLVRYAGTGQGPFYADPGTSITLIASTSSNQSSDFRGCSFVITGHIINNP